MKIFLLLLEVLSFPFLIGPLLCSVQGLIFDFKWSLKSEFLVLFLGCYLLIAVSVMSVMRKILMGRTLEKINLQIINKERLLLFILIIFCLAQIGFIININRLFNAGILNLVGSGRAWELTFGENVITNYLFFLNGYIVANYPAWRQIFNESNSRLRSIKIISLISFLSLFFHGVKGTVLFPIIIAYYHSRILGVKIPILNLKTIFLFIFILFAANSYLRDKSMLEGDYYARISKKILLYITPGYANLQKQIDSDSNFAMGTLTLGSLGNLRSIFHVLSTGERPSKNKRSTTRVSGTEIKLELVDEAYNTGTVFRSAYIDFGYQGFAYYILFFIIYLSLALSWQLRYNNSLTCFILSIALIQLLFCFWGNHFTRLQYIYWIMVSIIQFQYTRILNDNSLHK